VCREPLSRYVATAEAFFHLRELELGSKVDKVIYLATDNVLVAEESERDYEKAGFALTVSSCLAIEGNDKSNASCVDPFRQEVVSALILVKVPCKCHYRNIRIITNNEVLK